MIITIDVGYRNLGLCIYNPVNLCLVLKQESLVRGRFYPADTVRYVHEFVRRYQSYFDAASIVIIERQMRVNMRVIEAVLQSLFFHKCLVLHPRQVKFHFGLSLKDYQKNKKAVVKWADAELRQEDRNGELQMGYYSAKKRDDMADAYALLRYYLDTAVV